jgi:choline-glycine betaine transporter
VKKLLYRLVGVSLVAMALLAAVAGALVVVARLAVFVPLLLLILIVCAGLVKWLQRDPW